jgi:riboflavin synthase
LFTGLIEEVGKVRALRKHSGGARLAVETALGGLAVGDSIAIDGVCQTVVECGGGGFSCDVLPETLRVSTFGRYRPGTRVNLERSLASDARLGGHIVNGHVDGLGTATRISRKPLGIEIAMAPELFTYVVPKGSIAVNGVSLTIGPAPKRSRFEVFIVPYTWEKTNLKYLKIGSRVNIEIDIIAKYVERFVQQREGT